MFAAQQLSAVDYTVANRVTADVAEVVRWSYGHDLAWLARLAVDTLHAFDSLGAVLITLVVWVVHHTP